VFNNFLKKKSKLIKKPGYNTKAIECQQVKDILINDSQHYNNGTLYIKIPSHTQVTKSHKNVQVARVLM